MSTAAYVAWVLGCMFVLSLAVVIILLSCIDELRTELLKTRALAAVRQLNKELDHE